MPEEYTITEAQLARLKDILKGYNETVISEWNEDPDRLEVEKLLADIEFGSQTGFVTEDMNDNGADVEALIRTRKPVSKQECIWCNGGGASPRPAVEVLCDDHLREYVK